MKNIKFKLFPLVSSFVFLVIVSVLLIRTEKLKRNEKLNLNRQYYSELYQNWLTYKTEYDTQVTELRNQNTKAMETAKNTYNDLLTQQPDLIKQHTATGIKYVASNTITNNTTGNDSQTVKVTKTVSKPKTKAS